MEWLTAFKDFGFAAVMSIGLLFVVVKYIEALRVEIAGLREVMTKILTLLEHMDRDSDSKG